MTERKLLFTGVTLVRYDDPVQEVFQELHWVVREALYTGGAGPKKACRWLQRTYKSRLWGKSIDASKVVKTYQNLVTSLGSSYTIANQEAIFQKLTVAAQKEHPLESILGHEKKLVLPAQEEWHFLRNSSLKMCSLAELRETSTIPRSPSQWGPAARQGKVALLAWPNLYYQHTIFEQHMWLWYHQGLTIYMPHSFPPDLAASFFGVNRYEGWAQSEQAGLKRHTQSLRQAEKTEKEIGVEKDISVQFFHLPENVKEMDLRRGKNSTIRLKIRNDTETVAQYLANDLLFYDKRAGYVISVAKLLRKNEMYTPMTVLHVRVSQADKILGSTTNRTDLENKERLWRESAQKLRHADSPFVRKLAKVAAGKEIRYRSEEQNKRLYVFCKRRDETFGDAFPTFKLFKEFTSQLHGTRARDGKQGRADLEEYILSSGGLKDLMADGLIEKVKINGIEEVDL